MEADIGHPDTGATWLDIVATGSKAYGPSPVERLDSTARLRDWLADHDLLPETEPTEADLVRARALREALRGIALATVRHEPWPVAAVEFVNDVLADDRPLVPDRGGTRAPDTPRAALARVARQASEQLTGPAAATLRTCADPDCAMLFLDAGGRRRWCASQRCGVRNRVRAHRQRRTAEDVPPRVAP